MTVSRQCLKAMDKAIKDGAQEAEAYSFTSRSTTVVVSQGEVETLKVAEELGMALRVFHNKRLGFSYTTDLSASGLTSLAQGAVANAACTYKDDANLLPSPSQRKAKKNFYLQDFSTVSQDEKIRKAMDLEKAALQHDSRVTKVRHATYRDGDLIVALANSQGLTMNYKVSWCTLGLMAIAEDGGDSQYGWEMAFSRRFEDLKPEEVGSMAAQRALSLLGAKPIKTTTCPVLLDSSSATGFLDLIASSFKADHVQRGKSLFKDKLGQKVASEQVTIVDDGLREDGSHAAPFDDEGVPSSRTILIDKGVLQGFLYNTYTAHKDGVQSTGNGIRASYKGPPLVDATNLYLEPGKRTREELMERCGKGLMVMEILGMHIANPVSGDFSVGVNGLWLEGGQPSSPIRGVTLSGNIRDLLLSIEEVGRDFRFYGSTGAPSLLLAPMVISGL